MRGLHSVLSEQRAGARPESVQPAASPGDGPGEACHSRGGNSGGPDRQDRAEADLQAGDVRAPGEGGGGGEVSDYSELFR